METASDRAAARLSESAPGERSQSSALQRTLVGSFACPESLRGSGVHDDVATIDVLRRVRLLHFDYEQTPSRDYARALADCQRILRSGDAAEAEKLWQRLTGIADEKRTGGSINLAQLLERLRREFDLCDHPDYRRDWEELNRAGQEAMADVRTEIANLPPLTRDADRTAVQTHLDEHGACFLVGDLGSGKSALAKAIGLANYRRVLWLGPDALDWDTMPQFERAANIRHSLA